MQFDNLKNFIVLGLAAFSASAAHAQTTTEHEVSSRIEAESIYSGTDDSVVHEIVRVIQKHRFDIESGNQMVTGFLEYRLAHDTLSQENFGSDQLEKLIMYLDMPVGDSLFSLGMKEIFWGETVFMPILDLVNTRDINHPHSFYSPDAKVPALMAVGEVPVGSAVMQMIWLPAPQPLRQPDQIGEFTVAEPIPFTAGPDSEVGLRVGMPIGAVELNFYYLNHWSRLPSYKFDAFAGDSDLALEEERDTMLGSSFSYAGYDYVLKGDFARHSNAPATNIGTEIQRTGLSQSVLGCIWSGEAVGSLGLDFHYDRWDQQPDAYNEDALISENPSSQSLSWMVVTGNFSFANDKWGSSVAYLRGLNLKDEIVSVDGTFNATENATLGLRYQKIRADGHSPKILLDQSGEITTSLAYSF